MRKPEEKSVYPPGYYGRKMMSASDWAGTQVRKWERAKEERKTAGAFSPNHCICLSRSIGTGALEVAEFLSKKTGYQVVDKEIIEHMAKDSSLTERLINFYDERFPEQMSELLVSLSIEKKFAKNDYIKQLATTVTALSHTEPTIFVGRGTHLILPRHTILSVQLICSRKNRIEKFAKLLGIDRGEAETRIKRIDDEHHDFFKAVYLRDRISPDEFDLVIHMDHIKAVDQVAQIIACAFEQKFGKTFKAQ